MPYTASQQRAIQTMSIPRWNPNNLRDHHAKRIREDDCCWREILGISRSMTEGEYEKESKIAYQKASLEYEAYHSRYFNSLYRIDKRSILCICDRSRRWMKTCYHKHYLEKNSKAHSTLPNHVPGSASPKLEHLLEHIDDLEAALDGKLEKLYRIDPVTENLSSSQVRRYIKPKLKNLRSRCVTDE